MIAQGLGPVMLDIIGTELAASDRDRLRQPQTGGVILFARNFTSRDQLVDLVSEIRRESAHILIAVDHEGGRVQRFRSDGFTVLPSMARVGTFWNPDSPEESNRASTLALATGYVLAAELVACGIDLSFTPVLDLAYGPSEVIGDRALHQQAQVVAALARNLMHGLLLAGMSNCGKHFPGHGFVAEDSHHEIPTDHRSLVQIRENDMAPYALLGPALSAVMPAHVIYPQIDSLPAGFSSRWLNEILRGEIGFQGAIFSDDLSMQGASVMGDALSGAKAALAAGCDMVLICNAPQSADKIIEGLEGTPRSEISRARMGDLCARRRFGWDDLKMDWRYRSSINLLRSAGLVQV